MNELSKEIIAQRNITISAKTTRALSFIYSQNHVSNMIK